jgi:hypothetical protein
VTPSNELAFRQFAAQDAANEPPPPLTEDRLGDPGVVQAGDDRANGPTC